MARHTLMTLCVEAIQEGKAWSLRQRNRKSLLRRLGMAVPDLLGTAKEASVVSFGDGDPELKLSRQAKATLILPAQFDNPFEQQLTQLFVNEDGTVSDINLVVISW